MDDGSSQRVWNVFSFSADPTHGRRAPDRRCAPHHARGGESGSGVRILFFLCGAAVMAAIAL